MSLKSIHPGCGGSTEPLIESQRDDGAWLNVISGKNSTSKGRKAMERMLATATDRIPAPATLFRRHGSRNPVLYHYVGHTEMIKAIWI